MSRIQRVTFGLNRRRVVEATRTWTFSPLLQPTGFQPVVVEFSSWSSDQEEYQIDYAEYEKEHEEWIKRGARGKEPNSPQHPHQNRDWIIPDKRKYIGLKNAVPIDGETKRLLSAIEKRQKLAAEALGETVRTIEAQSIAPFVTGTGIEHPLENGMAFLNPYGLPYLPGSGVKGVVRRAAEELRDNVFGEGAQGWDPIAIDVLFGREPESGDSETERTRGALIFWDVFPKCDRLAVDIMNPHYGDYYQGNTPPTDCGQPIPIFFLTVPENSEFTFHVQCDRSRLPGDWPADRWHSLLETAFAHAFDWLGFGAKTAVGYGAMRRPQAKTPPPKPSTPDNTQKTAPAVGEIKNGATTTPEAGPQRWENVALFWNKGKGELQATTAQGRAFMGGKEGVNLREKLGSERRSKLDKGKAVTVTLTVKRIGGNNWRITDIA